MKDAWLEISRCAKPPLRYIIAIEGMPGVGKSTCIAALRVLEPKYICFDDGYTLLQPRHEQRFIEAEAQWKLSQSQRQRIYQEIYFDAEQERRDEILKQTRGPDVIILDRGVEGTIFATEHLEASGLVVASDLRKHYYRTLVDVRASHTILLEASLDILRARLTTRQRQTGSAQHREDYFRLFYSGFRAWFVNNSPKLTILNTEGITPPSLANEVSAVIRGCLFDVTDA